MPKTLDFQQSVERKERTDQNVPNPNFVVKDTTKSIMIENGKTDLRVDVTMGYLFPKYRSV